MPPIRYFASKALSPDHFLQLTLDECYEKARFAASVIKASRLTLDRIPSHSAQPAESRLPHRTNDKTAKSSGKMGGKAPS